MSDKTARDLVAEVEAFNAAVNEGRDAYTGGPKFFQHNGKMREADYPWLSDTQIAGMVRMLMRNDIGHEPIVCAARDRILHLSQVNASQAEIIAALVGALEGTMRLIRQAQDILSLHLQPDGNDDAEAIEQLYGLLDGPHQRETEASARAALAKAKTP